MRHGASPEREVLTEQAQIRRNAGYDLGLAVAVGSRAILAAA
jgi:hypothetical protein